MPSPRKRIGFLPRLEVQNIIDEICKQNKLSQSKVTGILVEEALTSRGVLDNNLGKKTFKTQNIDYDLNLAIKDNINNEIDEGNDKFNLNKHYINDEIQMINDFIEFKFFKDIMNKNKKSFNY